MDALYAMTVENGRKMFHGGYCLYAHHKATGVLAVAYDAGAIRLVTVENTYDPEQYGPQFACVSVFFEDGSRAAWNTTWITSYNYTFGLAVSPDGKYLFVQTWENGLLCFNSRTGQRIWKTKSKRGITSVFISQHTLLAHQHGRALQLIDMHSGEVLIEKRPATAWGFTAIDHKHIVCRVTAKRWEVIDAVTLETKKTISHREFTGGHEDYCIQSITPQGQMLEVRGFQNVWDTSVKPPKALPNLEFEHGVFLDIPR